MKVTFKEDGHKFWCSNIESVCYPMFTISTDFNNLYLPKSERPKKRSYNLSLNRSGSSVIVIPCNTLNSAKKLANEILNSRENYWIDKFCTQAQRYGLYNPLFQSWIFEEYYDNKTIYPICDNDGFYTGQDAKNTLKQAKKAIYLQTN